MQHTTPENESEDDHCECEAVSSVPYLDTSCSIKQGHIIMDLYRKPTDRNGYLLPDSCHIENIPLSLAIRITRICSETEARDARYYPEGISDAAIKKARDIPWVVTIRKVARDTTRTQSRRPVFAVSWDPRLPSVSALTQKQTKNTFLKTLIYPYII